MQKMIPYEKRSKREQRAYNRQRRGSWNGICPATRKIQSAKKYDRKKARKWMDDTSLPCSYFMFSLFA